MRQYLNQGLILVIAIVALIMLGNVNQLDLGTTTPCQSSVSMNTITFDCASTKYAYLTSMTGMQSASFIYNGFAATNAARYPTTSAVCSSVNGVYNSVTGMCEISSLPSSSSGTAYVVPVGATRIDCQYQHPLGMVCNADLYTGQNPRFRYEEYRMIATFTSSASSPSVSPSPSGSSPSTPSVSAPSIQKSYSNIEYVLEGEQGINKQVPSFINYALNSVNYVFKSLFGWLK